MAVPAVLVVVLPKSPRRKMLPQLPTLDNGALVANLACSRRAWDANTRGGMLLRCKSEDNVWIRVQSSRKLPTMVLLPNKSDGHASKIKISGPPKRVRRTFSSLQGHSVYLPYSLSSERNLFRPDQLYALS
jgi:hypothetical protein